MREARSYVGGEFMPASVEELVQLISAGGKHASFILQVYRYWDMVAAFVLYGALTPGLVYDTCQEMYFQFAKIQPYLASFRSRMNLPEFLKSIEQVVKVPKKDVGVLRLCGTIFQLWRKCVHKPRLKHRRIPDLALYIQVKTII
jgi:hypothetical protein